MFQPVSGDLLIKWGPRKKNCTDATITMTMTTADDIRAMEVPFVSYLYIICK